MYFTTYTEQIDPTAFIKFDIFQDYLLIHFHLPKEDFNESFRQLFEIILT